MTFITTITRKEGKVSVLISIDNYSRYCFGIVIEKVINLPEIKNHISAILNELKQKHTETQPLFVMAYGKEMIPELEVEFIDKATFLFNPTLADEIAMPAAKSLLEKMMKR